MNTTMLSPADKNRLKRIVLHRQGLVKTRPFGSGISGTLKAIKHLSYIQIDSISVVERAHHHVLYSRVPNYHPDILNTLLKAGDIFEYWSHAAAVLPIASFRFSLPYKHALKAGQKHWYKNPDRKLMAELLKHIRQTGPLRSRDLAADKKKSTGWGNWKPAKKALEQLYMEGDLMISDRAGFEKKYDLTERVLPADVDTTMPSADAFARHLLEEQLRCHGLVSLKTLTYLRRNTQLKKSLKDLIALKIAEHELEHVTLATGEEYYGEKGLLDTPLTRTSHRLLVLSPFDNSLIQRERLNAIFGFDYQLECYVPAEKRQYGYFSLPLLFQDTFIGRVDCKAHRKSRVLEIKSLHLDKHKFETDTVISAFTGAIKDFCVFQGCDTVTLTSVHPKQLMKPLLRALAPLR